MDAGTLEHVFNIPNALEELRHKLIVGGVIVHLNPGNGFFEHGFWQISPTLYRNFYQKAGFSIEAMGFYKSSPSRGILTDITFLKADRDLYRVPGGVKFAARLGRVTTFVVARKVSSSLEPIQSVVQDFYTGLHASGFRDQSAKTSLADAILKRRKIRWDFLYVATEVLHRFPSLEWLEPVRTRLLSLSPRFYAMWGLFLKIGFVPSVTLIFRYFAKSARRER